MRRGCVGVDAEACSNLYPGWLQLFFSKLFRPANATRAGGELELGLMTGSRHSIGEVRTRREEEGDRSDDGGARAEMEDKWNVLGEMDGLMVQSAAWTTGEEGDGLVARRGHLSRRGLGKDVRTRSLKPPRRKDRPWHRQ